MKVVFEDGWVCVIDKPAGVVVNAAESVKGVTIQGWFAGRNEIFQRRGPRPELGTDEDEFWAKGGVVHRLDKDTSGLMVLAKTPEAYGWLKKQFLHRTVEKVYVALAHGLMPEKSGVIALPVERHSKNKRKFTVGTNYFRTAVTEYDLLGVYLRAGEKLGLYRLKLRTGRTHQIRVHMKHFQHPLVADPIYGGKWCKWDMVWCPRLFLHACRIGFSHPEGGWMDFESEIPNDLDKVLKSLSAVER